ncbi:hypothetical protein HDU97_002187 [Phlyctochytrium planicorne]|nr:hypothetical protein HDU97_002187 [Phlyctochytrium planicorne]
MKFLTSTVLIASAVSSVVAAPALNERDAASAINWQPCTADDLKGLGLLCGALQVPVNYLDKSDNRTFALALSKFPATKPSRGAILVNPGGPGGKGLRFARSVARRLATALDGSFDIIGFDPRGIGASQSIVCYANPSLRLNFDGQEFAAARQSVSAETFDAFAAIRANGCQKYSAYNGEWSKYISTAYTARDMDSVREALGQDVLNYIGFSYGTVLGMTYVNMFPDRVGRVIIDGVADITTWTSDTFTYNKEAIQDTNEVLRGFATECANAGVDLCPLADLVNKVQLKETFTGPNVAGKQLYASIRKALEDLKPMPALDAAFPGVLKPTDVSFFLFSLLYGPANWQATAPLLADVLINKNPNEFRDNVFDASNFCPATDDSANNGYYAVRCSDCEDLSKFSLNDIVQGTERADRVSFLVRGSALDEVATCRHWSRPVERYTGPFNKKLRNKILILSATLDPVTPLASAKKVHSLLFPQQSSYLIVQKSLGHCSIAQPSSCTLKAVGNYLFNGTLLNEDKNGMANCVADTPIFKPAAASFAKSEGNELDDAAELAREIHAAARRVF